eukprot:1157665-Pelagomonas_calceolata.AAC.9
MHTQCMLSAHLALTGNAAFQLQQPILLVAPQVAAVGRDQHINPKVLQSARMHAERAQLHVCMCARIERVECLCTSAGVCGCARHARAGT